MIPNTIDAEAFRAKSERSSNDAFSRWMARPEIRMIISNIPAGDNQESLAVLLRSAFDTGVGCGGSEVMSIILEQTIKGMAKDK